jgi:hypothetical protein
MDGLTEPCLRAAGCEVLHYHHSDSGPPPALGGLAGIVSLGGEESAIDAARCPT